MAAAQPAATVAATFEGPAGELCTYVDGEKQPPNTWFANMSTSLDLESCHMPPDPGSELKITAAPTRQTGRLSDDQIQSLVSRTPCNVLSSVSNSL